MATNEATSPGKRHLKMAGVAGTAEANHEFPDRCHRLACFSECYMFLSNCGTVVFHVSMNPSLLPFNRGCCDSNRVQLAIKKK